MHVSSAYRKVQSSLCALKDSDNSGISICCIGFVGLENMTRLIPSNAGYLCGTGEL